MRQNDKLKRDRKVKVQEDDSLRGRFRKLLSNLDTSQIQRGWMQRHTFRLIDRDEDLARWVDEVLANADIRVSPSAGALPCPVVAVDTETTGLDTRILVHRESGTGQDSRAVTGPLYEVKVELAGVCLCADGINGVYIPVNHEGVQNVSREVLHHHLQRLFDRSHLVFFNAKFDREVLRLTAGIEFRPYPYFEDVQVLHYLIDPKVRLDGERSFGGSRGLKALARQHLDIDQIDLGAIGEVEAVWCPESRSGDCCCSEEHRRQVKHSHRKQHVPFAWLPTKIAVWYAAADAIVTWQLWDRFHLEAQARATVHSVDGNLIDSLAWMERQRCQIAREPLRRMIKWLDEEMASQRKNLRSIAVRDGWKEALDQGGKVGEETRFDANKPNHLAQLLFEIKRLSVVRRSQKTNMPSVDKEVLEELRKRHPEDEFLKALAKFRKYEALHPENLQFDPCDGSARIHLQQCRVAGGRLAAKGGTFEIDGGFGINVQAVKKVAGKHWWLAGRVLVPDRVAEEDVEHHAEEDLPAFCFEQTKQAVVTGWLETLRLIGPDGTPTEQQTVFPTQYPDDLEAVVTRTDERGLQQSRPKYAADDPARRRTPIRELRSQLVKAPNIVCNHIANLQGYVICLIPDCKTCAGRFGILIEKGRLDAYQDVNLRALFIAEDGWTFFSSDYSNIEMRVAANCTGEPEFVREFLEGSGDFHSLTASKVFTQFTDPQTSHSVRKQLRDLAKIINFALLYGGTSTTIFENMRRLRPDITQDETEAMVAAYWRGVPIYKKWCDKQVSRARRDLISLTETGRLIDYRSSLDDEDIRIPTTHQVKFYWDFRRLQKQMRAAEERGELEMTASLRKAIGNVLSDEHCAVRNTQNYFRKMQKIERQAVNIPLQGLAGDFMRMAINDICAWATRQEPAVQSVLRIHASVHDELDYTVKNEYLPFVVPRLTRIMKLRRLHSERQWKVPIEVDTEYGPRSWDVTHHVSGDTDHTPVGWTEVEGMAEYLPAHVTKATVDQFTNALASGQQDARDGVWQWAKHNLHPRAAKAVRSAFVYRDAMKEERILTELSQIRKQVVAALQLDEFWRIDDTPEDRDASLETLAQFEARCGLGAANRGFMPACGYLGSIPVSVGVRRPSSMFLGSSTAEIKLPELASVNDTLPHSVTHSVSVKRTC